LGGRFSGGRPFKTPGAGNARLLKRRGYFEKSRHNQRRQDPRGEIYGQSEDRTGRAALQHRFDRSMKRSKNLDPMLVESVTCGQVESSIVGATTQPNGAPGTRAVKMHTE
jgi:hypothetical protein